MEDEPAACASAPAPPAWAVGGRGPCSARRPRRTPATSPSTLPPSPALRLSSSILCLVPRRGVIARRVARALSRLRALDDDASAGASSSERAGRRPARSATRAPASSAPPTHTPRAARGGSRHFFSPSVAFMSPFSRAASARRARGGRGRLSRRSTNESRVELVSCFRHPPCRRPSNSFAASADSQAVTQIAQVSRSLVVGLEAAAIDAAATLAATSARPRCARAPRGWQRVPDLAERVLEGALEARAEDDREVGHLDGASSSRSFSRPAELLRARGRLREELVHRLPAAPLLHLGDDGRALRGRGRSFLVVEVPREAVARVERLDEALAALDAGGLPPLELREPARESAARASTNASTFSSALSCFASWRIPT